VVEDRRRFTAIVAELGLALDLGQVLAEAKSRREGGASAVYAATSTSK
jgi:hypothetical protein